MSDFWDGAKIVAKKALKWAGYGALACGVLSLPFVFGASAGSTFLSWITFGGVETAAGASIFTGALLNGAILGGVLGTIKGVADLPSDLQQIKDNRKFEQLDQKALQDRQALLAQSQQQAQAPQAEAGVPVQNLGTAQGQNMGQTLAVAK